MLYFGWHYFCWLNYTKLGSSLLYLAALGADVTLLYFTTQDSASLSKTTPYLGKQWYAIILFLQSYICRSTGDRCRCRNANLH